MQELEEGTEPSLDFEKLRKVGSGAGSVLPVVLQHAESEAVLFVGYANQQALEETLARHEAVLWSTSRNELWHKGATSGDVLELVEVRVNCEQSTPRPLLSWKAPLRCRNPPRSLLDRTWCADSLLYLVRPVKGGVCHTKDGNGNTRLSCYYRTLKDDGTLEMRPEASR